MQASYCSGGMLKLQNVERLGSQNFSRPVPICDTADDLEPQPFQLLRQQSEITRFWRCRRSLCSRGNSVIGFMVSCSSSNSAGPGDGIKPIVSRTRLNALQSACGILVSQQILLKGQVQSTKKLACRSLFW